MPKTQRVIHRMSKLHDAQVTKRRIFDFRMNVRIDVTRTQTRFIDTLLRYAQFIHNRAMRLRDTPAITKNRAHNRAHHAIPDYVNCDTTCHTGMCVFVDACAPMRAWFCTGFPQCVKIA